jgi:hypothetical protein
MATSRLLAALALALPAAAVNPGGFPNSLAAKPPMGYRTWNAWTDFSTQATLSAQLGALIDPRFPPNSGGGGGSTPVSLFQLGYNYIAQDDGWQNCGAGVNGSFHNATGWPMVDTDKFPDIGAWVASAHAVGVGAYW